MRKGAKRPANGCALSKKQIRLNYRNTVKGRLREALEQARYRAKRRGVAFDLTLDDIIDVPKMCPVLNVPMEFSLSHAADNSPSLDCIVPEQGYVKGNVAWISYRANRIKQDAELQELVAVTLFVAGHLADRKTAQAYSP